jgi:hypothetical protein
VLLHGLTALQIKLELMSGLTVKYYAPGAHGLLYWRGALAGAVVNPGDNNFNGLVTLQICLYAPAISDL